MSEATKVRKVSTFWQLPDAEARELVKQAQNKAAEERRLAREAEVTKAVSPVSTTASESPKSSSPRLPMPVMPYRESLEVGGRIADALGERAGEVRLKVRKIVRYFGTEACERWLAEAQAIHAGEGMLTQDGTRKRTLGGCWFHLVRSSPDRARVRLCFPRPAQRQRTTQVQQ